MSVFELIIQAISQIEIEDSRFKDNTILMHPRDAKRFGIVRITDDLFKLIKRNRRLRHKRR